MSKIVATLIEAIRSFNLSDCVKCLGEVQQDWLLTEDLNIWAGREVCTAADLEEWINYKHMYSDYHKEAHGFRPRWDYSDYSLSQWREEYASLEDSCEANLKHEQELERIGLEEFKKAVAKTRKAGAKDFMTAVKWLMQAEDCNPRYRQDVEMFFWDKNILYSGYVQSLIKRICPQRHLN